MAEYTAITPDGKYLLHYGVKGMKWGKNKKKRDYSINNSTDPHPAGGKGNTTKSAVVDRVYYNSGGGFTRSEANKIVTAVDEMHGRKNAGTLPGNKLKGKERGKNDTWYKLSDIRLDLIESGKKSKKKKKSESHPRSSNNKVTKR